jgi:hypothetical protein
MNKPLISDRLPTVMTYDKAIDLAFTLSNDDQEWRYQVEIEASTGKAKIAIFDETDDKIGYL